jgi:hypothetical protein
MAGCSSIIPKGAIVCIWSMSTKLGPSMLDCLSCSIITPNFTIHFDRLFRTTNDVEIRCPEQTQ